MLTTSPVASWSRRQLLVRFGRLTLLNIASNVTVPLASLVDTALLGHLSDVRYLAGVALGAILFEFVYWTFGFLRMGTTGSTAQAAGRRDREEEFLILYRGLLLALLLGLTILLLRVPLREAGFALLSGTPQVEAAGRDYFEARVWAAPATLANFVFLGWYLGRQQSGLALVMTILGNLANVGASYFFIAYLGLAARGAGLGTTLSQYFMLAVALALFLRQRGRAPWRGSAIWSPARVAELLRLNRDILIRTVALITAFALFTNFSSILGTTTLAANAILQRFQTLAAYLIDGAAFAAESLAGTFHGAGDRLSLDRLRRTALAVGAAFTLPFVAVFVLLPGPAVRLLTSQPETAALAQRYIVWLVPVVLIGSLAFIYDGIFLGLTAGRPLRNAMLVSTLLVFLPLAWAAVHLGSNHLLWGSMTAFMLARTATLWCAERFLRPAPSPQST